MATLIDQELYKYLDHLESEVKKRLSESDSKSLQYLIHSQMKNLIESEKSYLKYANSNGTNAILRMTLNGLPSLDSLKPDLEAMCELAEEETEFKEIAERYKKGIDGKNNGNEGNVYANVSEEEWEKALKDRESEKLYSKIGFAVNETEDGKFELSVREDVYLDGFDQYSKEFPVLIKEGKIRYHLMWNSLLEDCEENFYIPSTSLVLKRQPIKPKNNIFDNIKKEHYLKKSDFQLIKKPGLFWIRSVLPEEYKNVVAAGLESRVECTESILKMLGEILGKKIDLRKKEDRLCSLWEKLDFSNDISNIIPCGHHKCRNPDKEKYIFHLSLVEENKTSKENKIGKITYILPSSATGYYHETGWKRHDSDVVVTRVDSMGSIVLTINGSAIENESQYVEIQERTLWGKNGNTN